MPAPVIFRYRYELAGSLGAMRFSDGIWMLVTPTVFVYAPPPALRTMLSCLPRGSWQPSAAQVGVKISFWTRVKVAVGSIGSPPPTPPGVVGTSLSLPQPTRSKRTTRTRLLILGIGAPA